MARKTKPKMRPKRSKAAVALVWSGLLGILAALCSAAWTLLLMSRNLPAGCAFAATSVLLVLGLVLLFAGRRRR